MCELPWPRTPTHATRTRSLGLPSMGRAAKAPALLIRKCLRCMYENPAIYFIEIRAGMVITCVLPTPAAVLIVAQTFIRISQVCFETVGTGRVPVARSFHFLQIGARPAKRRRDFLAAIPMPVIDLPRNVTLSAHCFRPGAPLATFSKGSR